MEREDKGSLKQDWEQKQDDLNELISQLEEQIAVKNLELSDPIRKKQEVMVEKLDQNKTSLEKQLVAMRQDLKSCGSQMSALKVSRDHDISWHFFNSLSDC